MTASEWEWTRMQRERRRTAEVKRMVRRGQGQVFGSSGWE